MEEKNMEEFRAKMFLVYRMVIEETYRAYRLADEADTRFKRVQCKAAALMGDRICRVFDVATADNTSAERLDRYINDKEYRE